MKAAWALGRPEAVRADAGDGHDASAVQRIGDGQRSRAAPEQVEQPATVGVEDCHAVARRVGAWPPADAQKR